MACGFRWAVGGCVCVGVWVGVCVTETNENIYHRNNQTRKKFIRFVRYDGNSILNRNELMI